VLSWNLYFFPERFLVEGRFDRVLLRPVSSVFQVLFESFRLESLQESVVGVGAVIWASRRLGIAWGPLDVFLFVVWAACGAAIYLAIFVALTATSFWIEDRIGISPPVFNLMQFGRYPLTIYDAWVRVALSFVIPFAFASFYPTARFLRREEFLVQFWAVPLVAAVTLTLALSLWRAGVKRYHSTGT
jgi:ABC-2 type transport system permease protein